MINSVNPCNDCIKICCVNVDCSCFCHDDEERSWIEQPAFSNDEDVLDLNELDAEV